MSEVYYETIRDMLRDRGYNNIPDDLTKHIKNNGIYIKSNISNLYIYDSKDTKITLTDIRKLLKDIYTNQAYYKNGKIDLDLHILIIKKKILKIEENIFIKKIPFENMDGVNEVKVKGLFETITKKLEDKLENKEELKTKEPNIEYYDTENLMINITKHDIMPKFEIYNTDEKKKEILDILDNINPILFPKMLITDPVAKYYNLKIGDLIKIKRTSPLSGEAISFRIII